MPKTIPSIMRRRAETRGLTESAGLGGGLALAAPSVAGVLVTPQMALTFTAVFAAINVISRDFASLPPAVYRKRRGGGRSVDFRHPAHALLNREPNPLRPRSNALRFRQSLMGHCLGWGNGFWEIKRDGGGEPVALVALHPGKTRPKETESGRLYYETEDGRKLLPEDIFHLAGLGFDGVTGYSPVGMAREAVGMGKAAEEFGASLFGNGAVPKGVLKSPKVLKDNARKNLRESVYQVHQGSRKAHNLMILEDGVEFEQTSINPEDAQFLATRAFQVLEIARIFSIPPHKIGDYSQSHLANVEESNLDYLTTTLAGWVEAFEAEANLKLLSEEEHARGLYVGHDMTRLLRGNMAARVAYYTGLRNLGAISADEIRARENMNPIGPDEGGDKYLVNGAVTTLRAAGEAPGPAPTADPAAPEPPGSLDEPGDGDEPSTPTTEQPADDGGGEADE